MGQLLLVTSVNGKTHGTRVAPSALIHYHVPFSWSLSVCVGPQSHEGLGKRGGSSQFDPISFILLTPLTSSV